MIRLPDSIGTFRADAASDSSRVLVAEAQAESRRAECPVGDGGAAWWLLPLCVLTVTAVSIRRAAQRALRHDQRG